LVIQTGEPVFGLRSLGNQIREGNRKLSESAPCRLTIFGHGADKRGVDLISDALPFGRLWYAHDAHINYSSEKFFKCYGQCDSKRTSKRASSRSG